MPAMPRRSPRRAARALLALAGCLLLGLAFTACEDDDGLTLPPPPAAPRATSPDSLMSLFVSALELMDVGAYAGLLDTAYVFVPDPADLADLGLIAGQVLDRATELVIAQRMFSGVAGAFGVPGLTDIQVWLLAPESAWQPSTDPAYPGAVERLYRVEIHFVHPNGYYRVTTQQKFWAVDRAEAGEEQPRYTLLAHREFGRVVKVQDHTWGSVKGLFR